MRLPRVFFITLFAVFAVSFQTFAQGDEDDGGPRLWKIEDEDTTIYLFGTIHILNSEVVWITPELSDAFSASDAIILESSPDQQDPAVLEPLIEKYGRMPEGETLAAQVSEETYAELQATLTSLGASGNAMDNMRPWLGATILAVEVAAAYGFLPQYGVEEVLMEGAADAGKPVYGLEMSEDVFAKLGNLPDADQDVFLKSTLQDIEDLNELFSTLRDAWLAGNLEALDEELNSDIEDYPNIAEALLYSRNRAWINVINGYMDTPGTFLLAVGAGHFIGQQNVLLLLEEEGYAIILVR